MPAAPASFEPEPASVGAARRYAVRLVQASSVGHLQDDVRTVVSELVTNAVLHARTPFTVTVVVQVDGVRVAVTDASPARPRLPRHGDLSGTTGRGLRIVAHLCRDWGVDAHDDGKTTWCLLSATAPGARHEGAASATSGTSSALVVDPELSRDRTDGAASAAAATRPDRADHWAGHWADSWADSSEAAA